MADMIKAEYIWIDGTEPTKTLRSKTKIMEKGKEPPDWGFDGSSTNQAEGHASDCRMKPVFVCPDPIRGGDDILVLTEVFTADDEVHPTNTRNAAAAAQEKHAAQEAWFGMEQEYTMFQGSKPLGWPDGGYPAPQGPFYCGVGAEEVFGREIVEKHMDACVAAGLVISGVNAEVMPGQWEFQIGPTNGITEAGDHMIMARYLLYRIAEDYGVTISLDPKPVRGDWNGAGCHTNYSTKAMREDGGLDVINAACEKLGAPDKVALHIANYGAGIEQRLTGLHETCSYKEFKYGVSDRGASIRIPMDTAIAKKGYLEDRRPCANIDPYVVARLLVETTCGD